MDEIPKPKFWARLRQWISRHRKIVWITTGVLVISLAGLTTFFILSQKPAEPAPVVHVEPKPEPPPEPVKYYSPLTGNLVADEAATKQAVTAIMIENSPDARPQSGLKESGVVFEAIAEGGITRFLVIYQQEKPKLIGPVRSVRMYYVDWLAAFNASVAHVGGSAASLREVRNGNYRDIDQFFNSGTYWRATDRYAPHNVYTNFKNIDALNDAKGYKTSEFTGFTRIDGEPAETPTAASVDITISSVLYNSHYSYDKKTNTYARSQAGAAHLDRESGQIKPSVVIAMRVDEKTVMEDGYRQEIKAIGSGKATIFQNGTATNVTWNKASRTGQITFEDAEGKDVPLVRGQTWIAAVPNGTGAVSWK
ncbi:MAG TPA: DUF3048 domain-containing protein [Candidatus Saccharimonadales bacterium]|nr:DUF3048 domain-containing protein [Candidatus Saccharimonadales bacterium]